MPSTTATVTSTSACSRPNSLTTSVPSDSTDDWAALRDLRVIGGGASASAKVKVNIDLQPRAGSLTEINVIGCTVDEALSRLEKFLDESTVTDQQVLRIIHGHGTGQLRRAVAEFLKGHPLVARFEAAKMEQGGGGVTVVELKD